MLEQLPFKKSIRCFRNLIMSRVCCLFVVVIFELLFPLKRLSISSLAGLCDGLKGIADANVLGYKNEYIIDIYTQAKLVNTMSDQGGSSKRPFTAFIPGCSVQTRCLRRR